VSRAGEFLPSELRQHILRPLGLITQALLTVHNISHHCLPTFAHLNVLDENTLMSA